MNKELLAPSSVVVVGGSDDVSKPGGAVLRNLLASPFTGPVYVVNPKADVVQGVEAHRSVEELPQVGCAIIAVAAKYCLHAVEVLAREKGTRAFVILSAGFSEESPEGAAIERAIVEVIDSVGGSLVGPNCTGLLTANYNASFPLPVPQLDPRGIDLVSGSGATAIFIVDGGMRNGLRFNSVWSVGNSAQTGVEEVLEHLDETFDPAVSSRVKLLYVESITKPAKFLRHASSLRRKGCLVAAIKSGSSEAGGRAASSHTGAMASPDVAVEALFRKAGIVRCGGREELTTVAGIFAYPPLKGNRIAIVTHAGGPAVMLTDVLSTGGMEIPHLEGPKAQALLEKLFPGSSVGNPVDFLATGTAAQLGAVIDACNDDFDEIDGMVVIFGSPGLFPIYDVYELLSEKIARSRKPIFPVFPSHLWVKNEIEAFVARGGVYFPDEVVFGAALSKVYNTPPPAPADIDTPAVDVARIRRVVDSATDGYLAPAQIHELLDAAAIPRAREAVATDLATCLDEAHKIGWPLVMKVVGPVHKSDVGGVVLGVRDDETLAREFNRMMQIPDTVAIMLARQLSGTEVFIGAKREGEFGHIVMCGLGGIFIEVLKDVRVGLAPLSVHDGLAMLRGLRSHGLIKGVRGREGVNEERFAEAISRVSALVEAAPEIFEMDLNPLLGNPSSVTAVDARIRLVR
jgi:acetyltransferase